jgi:hypothetical protein
MTPAFFCGKHLLDLDHGLLRDTTFSYHSAGVGRLSDGLGVLCDFHRSTAPLPSASRLNE